MDKITKTVEILEALGMPKSQQSKLCALTILALAKLKKDDQWNSATNEWFRIHDLMSFIYNEYGVSYAENTRETFRKQAMHPFRDAALIEDNGKATNSPEFKYRLTAEFLEIVKELNDDTTVDITDKHIKKFISEHESLKELYSSKKKMSMMPVKINSHDLFFSAGQHNKLQKAIIEEFAPRFAENSTCLYVGDTVDKDLLKDDDKLKSLGFEITLHDKMPDVVLYREDTDWLYFIEAVDSVGPMSPARVMQIQNMTKNVKSGEIFISAFLTFDKYRQFVNQLAWETEVWIAEYPDHMIHLNGDKFLGPRK